MERSDLRYVIGGDVAGENLAKVWSRQFQRLNNVWKIGRVRERPRQGYGKVSVRLAVKSRKGNRQCHGKVKLRSGGVRGLKSVDQETLNPAPQAQSLHKPLRYRVAAKPDLAPVPNPYL